MRTPRRLLHHWAPARLWSHWTKPHPFLAKTCLDMGWEGEIGVPKGQPVPGVIVLPEEVHPAWLAKFSHMQLPAQKR